MGSLNKVMVIGNLGQDAELRYTKGGTAVANFSVATTEQWNDKQTGERREQTEWHRVVLWGNQAEKLQEYLRKGKQIYLEGRLQTRQWEDRDGNKRYTTEVRADRIVLLGRRADRDEYSDDSYAGGSTEPQATDGGGNGQQNAGGADLTEDDIPF